MKYYGKEKCKILKQIRAEIAKQNDIEWVVEECTHKGNCKGTCPRCEAEVRQLENALARREAMGRTVAVIGISAGLALSLSGCDDSVPSVTSGVMPDTSSNDIQTEVSKGEALPDTETKTPALIMGDMVIETEEQTDPFDMGEVVIIPDEQTQPHDTETEDQTKEDSGTSEANE